jgi:predicted  nucleic acid-binding Zn-ribbon protein
MNPPNKKLFADFILEAKKIWKGFYQYEIIGEYINCKERNIKGNCPIHGYFYTSYANHIHLKIGCKDCGTNKRGFSRRLSENEVLRRVEKLIHSKPELIKVKITGGYVNSYKKNIIITCQKHGEFNTCYNNFVHNENGCPDCGIEARERFAASNRNGIEKFLQQAIEIHKNIYTYEFTNGYTSSRAKNILATCTTHGNFPVSYNNHISLKQGCPKCSKENSKKISSGEKTLIDYFNNKNIHFIKEWSPEDLKSKLNRKVRFDFYLPDYNMVLEFHGLQHNIVGIGGEKGLKSTLRNDLLKEKYAWEKGIKYLVLREFHLKNISKAIQPILPQLTNNYDLQR